jgi:hypothetical protein
MFEPCPPLYWGFLIPHNYTHGRIPLDEWSARRRGLYVHRTTRYINTRDKLDEIWGSHGNFYHIVAEVLGFGAVCICRSIPSFRRNMLSPSSGTEMTRQRRRGVHIGPEEQGLREGSRSERGNVGTGCGPIGSLQEGYREGAGCGMRKERRWRQHVSPKRRHRLQMLTVPKPKLSSTQEKNVHTLSEIWTRDPSSQAAADLGLRPRGHRDLIFTKSTRVGPNLDLGMPSRNSAMRRYVCWLA